MDFETIIRNGPFILFLLALLALQVWLGRKGKLEKTRPEVVVNLLTEVKLNQQIVKVIEQLPKPRKFETNAWSRNKNRITFLGEELDNSLEKSFGKAIEINKQITAYHKAKKTGQHVEIRLDGIAEFLAESREGLEQWMLKNTGSREPKRKYPGMFDGWLGGG